MVQTSPDKRRDRQQTDEENASFGPLADQQFAHECFWGSVVFLQIHAGVKAGHLIPVAVEHQGVALEKFPEAPLLGLAPARMIHCWIHIGVETVFVGSEAI